jgi:hypothetical protein
MSVPPQELMKLMAGGGGKRPLPGARPVGAAAPGNAPPVGSPMTTPQPKEGLKQDALIKITTAMDVLEQTLPGLGSETEEGKAVLSALSTLSKQFGKQKEKAKELVPAELMSLMQSMPAATGGSPEMKAMKPPMPGAGMPPGMPAAA